jgi:hypothetical protein
MAPAAAGAAQSLGSVKITSSVSTDPANSCDMTASMTFIRMATLDITTTETDGTSNQLTGTLTSTSTRDPSAMTFTQETDYDVTRTDLDASGATVATHHLRGKLTEAIDASGSTPTRTENGTLSRDNGDGTSATVTLKDVVRGDPKACRWPTSGSIREVGADGTTHQFVFGACGQATLDGTTVTLPTGPTGPMGDGTGRRAGDHGAPAGVLGGFGARRPRR